MKRAIFFVVGMTCPSCEARIRKALDSLDGVASVRVSLKGGRVDVEYDDGRITVEAMKAAVEKIGYTVGGGRDRSTGIALGIGAVLAALYMAASSAGVFNALPTINASLGYGMLFVVGLLTSVHCVAMCGGIALSQSVARLGLEAAEKGRGTSAAASEGGFKRLVPGLLYNGGRVVSYTIIGGLVGALGAAFSFSPLAKGLVAAAAAVFMLLLGLKMLGILPGLPRISRIMPSPLRAAADRLSSGLKDRGPFAVGLLNGLMPCGPLQTMQLYALGTGSFFAGALSMFIFAIGTVPLLLVFGLASALMPRRFVPVMVKASAVLVMFLGVLTLGRAAALAGIALPELSAQRLGSVLFSGTPPSLLAADQPWSRGGGAPVKATLQDGVQSVLTDFGSSGYYLPFVVQAGIPVKWTIRVTADGLNGCNNPVTVPSYGIKKTLVPGDNLIEFVPKKSGVIPYTCWMGMISSRITVVDDLAGAELPSVDNAARNGGTARCLCCQAPSGDILDVTRDTDRKDEVGNGKN